MHFPTLQSLQMPAEFGSMTVVAWVLRKDQDERKIMLTTASNMLGTYEVLHEWNGLRCHGSRRFFSAPAAIECAIRQYRRLLARGWFDESARAVDARTRTATAERYRFSSPSRLVLRLRDLTLSRPRSGEVTRARLAVARSSLLVRGVLMVLCAVLVVTVWHWTPPGT
jgi:hypothetical protein